MRLLAACATALLLASLALGCGYRHYAGPLTPATASLEVGAGSVEVTRSLAGAAVALRPMTADELERLYGRGDPAAPNPYTFEGRVTDGAARRQRFTVFRLTVANRERRAVRTGTAGIRLRTAGGRVLQALPLEALEAYYRTYVVGYRGNEYSRYQKRLDLLGRTLWDDEPVFRGHSRQRFVVFPTLPHDVEEVTVEMEVELVSGYGAGATQTATVEFDYRRDIGRLYSDGRVVIDGQ